LSSHKEGLNNILEKLLDEINMKLSSSSEKIEDIEEDIDEVNILVDVADENGIFEDQNAVRLEEILEPLKKAREKLEFTPPDFPASLLELSLAKNRYYKAVHNASRPWRFSKLHGGYILAYLLLFLSGVFSFTIFKLIDFSWQH
jgi:hypothetical protein